MDKDSDVKSDSDESGSESDEDKSSGSESDEEGEDEIPKLAEKESPSFKLDKKKKLITYNKSSWGGCRAKKPCTKYVIELVQSNNSLMYGFIELDKYNGNSYNYSNGYSWYATSGGLYGSSFFNGSSSFPSGECTSGTKYGVLYDPKKGLIHFFKNGEFIQTGFQDLKKKKLYPIIDVYDSGSTFKFVKPKLKKIKK